MNNDGKTHTEGRVSQEQESQGEKKVHDGPAVTAGRYCITIENTGN